MRGHILEEWRIQDVERKANHAESKLYEIDALRSDVADLERTTRQLSSEVNELRAQLSQLQDYAIAQMQEQIAELSARVTE